jgi:sulfur relay (sulfurtransferase) DsrF/TusC family protein
MKKIAVIISNRQAEALRVAAGLTLLDDAVDIFLLDNKLNTLTEPSILKNIQMLNMIESVGYFYNFKDESSFYNKFIFLNNTLLAKKLLDYDYIIKY